MTSLLPDKTAHHPAHPARLRPALAGGALILLACILSYAPVLHGKFLWDDLYLVGSNPFFKSPRFFIEVFRHYLFLDSFSVYYRPVQNWSYMLDYAVWNRNEFGYHLSNVLFHAASGFLLFLTVHRCLRGMASTTDCPLFADAPPVFIDAASFTIGLLWAVHPIHNAAVAYVAGRADSIAMMFALTGWLLFLNDGPNLHGLNNWRRRLGMAVAPFCFLLAVCAKEIALVWMGLFVVYLLGFELRRSGRAKVAIVVSLPGVLGVYLWLRHLPGPRAAQEGVTYPGFADRVLLMLRALGDYSSLIFFPGNLHMERTVWDAAVYGGVETWQEHLRGEYLSLAGLATLGVFVYACASRMPGRKIRVLGVTWFVLGFLPVSNLFPLNAQVAEHWVYMASAGYLVMLAGFACAMPGHWQRRLAGAAPIVILALGVRTAWRAADWADPETFYRQTIAAGGFPERVSLNLADVCAAKGNLKEAEGILRNTVAQFPGYPPARMQLGANLLRQGRGAEAAMYLQVKPEFAEKVAASTPQSWRTALNLAGIQAAAHNADGALAILDEAVRRYPDVWELTQYRAELLEATRGAGAALPGVADYAGRNWWHIESHLMLAGMEAEMGRYQESLAVCSEAATLDIHSAAPFEQEARTDVLAHRFADALEAQAGAIARGPVKPAQYEFLAGILSEMHEPDEAMEAMRMARVLMPGAGG